MKTKAEKKGEISNMGYQILKFGSLSVNSELFNLDGAPANMNGFMSASLNFADTSNSPSHTLTWIQPDGCKFLICDRVLLTGISWARLHALDYDGGRKVSIDGNTYYVRLPTRKEWKAALRGCGTITDGGRQRKGEERVRALLHLSTSLNGLNESFPFSWTKDTETTPENKTMAFACGETSVIQLPAFQTPTTVGFRPILVPEKKNTELYRSQSVIVLDGQIFSVEFPASIEHGSSRADFRPSLVPMKESSGDGGYKPDAGVFSALEPGQSVQMYSLVMNGQPIPIQENNAHPYQPGAALSFSDHYYGDKYLIWWTIREGKAVAAWPILRDISKDEIMEQAFFQEDQAKLW